jgi:hypothetical protein
MLVTDALAYCDAVFAIERYNRVVRVMDWMFFFLARAIVFELPLLTGLSRYHAPLGCSRDDTTINMLPNHRSTEDSLSRKTKAYPHPSP